jgi:hypothetical protein
MSTSPSKEPRPARQKLTINLSNQSATRLRNLAESREETLNDCVESALNVFNYLVQARLDGYTILLQNQADGTTRELVLLDLPDPVPGAQVGKHDLAVDQVVDQIVDELMDRLNGPGGSERLRAAVATPLSAKAAVR